MRLMQSTVCWATRPLVRFFAVDRKAKSTFLGRHADHCLRCQAESAIEDRIHRMLSGMKGNLMPAPAGLMPSVRGSLDMVDTYADVESARSAEKVAIAAAVVGVASVVAWTVTRRVRGGG
ncbi:MAG: hypothetical protein F4Z79_07960 [Acidimicrobiia bacterium]|nr:hypothetical protein [Acidimicrobiia bacterium]